MSRYLHFTLGPVQSFVEQARRSKDLWAGSFLLSWLTGVAMAAVKHQNQGKILFPQVEDHTLAAFSRGENGPAQGVFPNRFTAHILDDSFKSKSVADTVRSAWNALADTVWKHDVLPILNKPAFSPEQAERSQDIWQRQVKHFWEINWVVLTGQEGKDQAGLAMQRKQYRTHFGRPEPGQKCMIMAGWQELSGLNRNADVSGFWQQLRAELPQGEDDLHPGEQLCALMLIKRRFARHFSGLEITNVSPGLTLRGWSFNESNHSTEAAPNPTRVPSLPLIAAMPFMLRLTKAIADHPDQTPVLKCFVDQAKRTHNHCFSALDEALSRLQDDTLNALPTLDPMSYFPAQFLAQKATRQQNSEELNAEIIDLNQSLDKLKSLAGKPSPYYSLLLMDGDNMGQLLQKKNSDPKQVAKCLQSFTEEVQPLVEKHNGFLIYAGGDDVLALLPVPFAIDCAHSLHDCYQHCFAKQGFSSTDTSLSGAIEYAHSAHPMLPVLKDAHRLLDDIAKRKTGRDSLAIRILKPGGEYAQWSHPWTRRMESDNHLLHTLLHSAVQNLRQYRIPQRLLCKWQQQLQPLLPQGESHTEIDDELIYDIAAAELMRSDAQLEKGKEVQQANALARQLLAVCCQYVRKPDGSTPKNAEARWNLDGLKLLRFLSEASFAPDPVTPIQESGPA